MQVRTVMTDFIGFFHSDCLQFVIVLEEYFGNCGDLTLKNYKIL